jgi:hypothetical protein
VIDGVYEPDADQRSGLRHLGWVADCGLPSAARIEGPEERG